MCVWSDATAPALLFLVRLDVLGQVEFARRVGGKNVDLFGHERSIKYTNKWSMLIKQTMYNGVDVREAKLTLLRP